MQETRNNCFGSKKCSTILLQVKTGKHKSRNVHCCYVSTLVLTYFPLTKGRATFFRPETIVVSFLHLMVLFYKVIFNHTSKCHFVVLLFFMTIMVVLTLCNNLFSFQDRNRFSYTTIIISVSLLEFYTDFIILNAKFNFIFTQMSLTQIIFTYVF